MPNPFNSATVIRFDLERPTNVELSIYSLSGQKMALVSGPRGAGSYAVRWDGRDDDGQTVASGTYLYRLVEAGDPARDLTQTRKLLLLR